MGLGLRNKAARSPNVSPLCGSRANHGFSHGLRRGLQI